MEIREMRPEDWESVATIYEEGLATRLATFETTCPSWEDWDRTHLSYCRFVLGSEHHLYGWAALSPVSDRCVYGGVAEVSVYVSENYRGQGVGTRLLRKLIKESEKHGIWTLQSSLFTENRGSYAIHKKLGFREIGIREKIGKLDGRWKDTVMLEKRSGKFQ